MVRGIVYKKDMKEVDVAVDIVCDACKLSCCKNGDFNSNEGLSIAHGFGYHSDNKDGLVLRAFLCEPCIDKMVKHLDLLHCYEGSDYWAGVEDLHPRGYIEDTIRGHFGQMDFKFPLEGAIAL